MVRYELRMTQSIRPFNNNLPLPLVIFLSAGQHEPGNTTGRIPVMGRRRILAFLTQNIFQKSGIFLARKITMQNTTTHHQITTTSPRFTITKTHKFPKTPRKNTI
jgi:hypothetical protein